MTVVTVEIIEAAAQVVEVVAPGPSPTVEALEAQPHGVVEVTQPGPPGPAGDPGEPGDPAPTYATLIDSTSPTTIYVGKAPEGAAVGDATWTIRRSTFSAAGVLLTTGTATNVNWTNRTSHVYT